MPDQLKCEHKVFRNHHFGTCGRKACATTIGPRCTIHSPTHIDARKAKREEKWKERLLMWKEESRINEAERKLLKAVLADVASDNAIIACADRYREVCRRVKAARIKRGVKVDA
jgi:hypothetical protein